MTRIPQAFALLVALFQALCLPAMSAAGVTPEDLWSAARQGDLAGVRAALEGGVAVDAAQRFGGTALLVAAGAGHVEIARLLLEKGADVDSEETFWGTTALTRALQSSHVAVAEVLVEAGAAFDNQGLQMAVATRSRPLVEKMLAQRTLYAFEKDDAVALARVIESPEMTALLEAIESRDEVPVIQLSPESLGRYAGVYARADDDTATVELAAQDAALKVSGEALEGSRLVPVSPRHFRSAPDPQIGVFFVARAGLVDGFMWMPRGEMPIHFRKQEDAGHRVSSSEPPDAMAARPKAPREPARPWLSFRGPGASGVSDGQGVVADWDAEDGRNVRWKIEVPGLGLSSPVVDGERIYLTTAVTEGDQSIRTGTYGDPASVEDDSKHDWQVLAYAVTDGRLLWRRSLGAAVPKARRHLKSSHANSTVATDGKTVVAVFPTAGMVALDATNGEVRWQQDLGALSSGTDDKIFQWGFASSPILWRGLVILQVDIHDGSYVAAWDLETGERTWRTERDEIPTWATPTVVEHGEHAELVTNGTRIRGYDPATGRELWTLGPNSEIAIATPIGGDGVAYVTAGYPPVRTIYAVRLGHQGDLSLENGASKSEAIAWSHTRGGGYMPTPVLYRGLFYLPHHNGRLVAYDPKSGETVYRARFSKRGTLTGSPVASDGMLFFTTEEGQIYVVEAGRTYRELAVHEMGAGIMTTPAISDGSLYIRTLEHLWALGETIAEEAAEEEKGTTR